MTGLAITVTDLGRAALTAAQGTNSITIAEIGLSETAVTPSAAATALAGELKRLTTFSGEAPDDATIHLTIRDDSLDSYNLRAFALYLSDGTLFGLYGNGDSLIMEKASASMLLLAVDIRFTESGADAITFGDTSFTNPPATTERQGVVELTTEAEATAGTDTTRAVTAKAMLTAVTTWIDSRFGAGAPSTFIKGILTAASAAVVRTALGLKAAALKDEGAGNGLDADLLDGQHATAFAAASHTHTIANVTNLQSSLDAKLASASYTAADVMTKLLTVDGTGSGIDADLLDGKEATAFAAASHAHAISEVTGLQTALDAKLAIADYTAADVKTKLLTVDGSGSGVDADLLDGKEATAFAAVSHSHAISEVTGLQTALDAKLAISSYTAADVLAKIITVDGSGSGLDADLLDGNHASAFAAASHSHDYLPRTSVSSYAAYGVGTALNNYYGILFGTTTAALAVMSTTAGLGGFYQQSNNKWVFYWDGSNAYTNGGKIWHEGNDGSGSGLDADLLDGQHATAFAAASHTHTISSITDLQTALDAKLASASYTAADVRTKLLTVDGSGSGIDADLLDGMDSSAYTRVTAFYNTASGGYRIWSDGFKECWGSATAAGNGTTTVTYPITFSSWSLAVCSGGKANKDASDNGPFVYATATTNCTIYNAVDDTCTTIWRAWGY